MTDTTVADPRKYRPIRDYALIGDCHGAALVASDGSIDWCCLERFDADPIFCRMLDVHTGGYLSAAPSEEYTVTRSYIDGTNILRTTFTTKRGILVLTDFMPVGRRPGSGTHNYVDLAAPNYLVRMMEVPEGSVELNIRYRPSLGFARDVVSLRGEPGRILSNGGPVLYHDAAEFLCDGDQARATIRLDRHRKLNLILAMKPAKVGPPLNRIDEYKSVTTAFWREWLAYCRYQGRYRREVQRSLLTIKLLVYAPSGAIAAAATTSLPEQIGGTRNWDYRFCWLRDAAFTLYALAVTGYGGEARRFSEYLPRVCAATAPDLRIMYGIDGETDLEEKILDHLEGHRGSRPVRQGNGAYLQRQIDVYGEILDWALLFETLGGHFNKDARVMLAAFADFVTDHWREPDQGLWEMRGPPLHHVHGKIMSWVALDRAIRLIGENPRWERERDHIAAEVNARGRHTQDGHLLQAYDHSGTDAALLLAPMTAFPLNDRVLAATIAAIRRQLQSGDFVYRYKSEDGMEGEEGAFFICSFWLVDALLQIGRHHEAGELFEHLLSQANDVGLYAEEIDPTNNEFLGNFPQAYTHLALVGSAVHLQLFEKLGVDGLRGSYADRAKRSVSATLGWRAIWAAFKVTWRVGRILPSRNSIWN